MSANIVHTNIATSTNGAPMVQAPVEADREAILKYLLALWPEGTGKLFLNIWRPGGGSKWIGGATSDQGSMVMLETAADYIYNTPVNCYTGMLLADRDYGPQHRLSRKEGRLAAGACGVWLDIDMAGPGHKAQNLPASVEQVKEIFYRAGLARFLPTLTIHSGGGLHCYWLLKERWDFAVGCDPRFHDRDQFASIARRFHRLVRDTASSMGLATDPFVLEQPLRPTGTLRSKPGCDINLVRVYDELSCGTRYNQFDFEELLAGVVDQHEKREDAPVKVGLIRIDPRATIPPEDFKLLMEVDATGLSPIWNCTKHLGEKAVLDDSFHERDMQMANYLARAGCDAQRMATWLIHFRREKSKPEHRRPKHLGYYELTIGKAIDSAEDDQRKKNRLQDAEAKKKIEAAETAQLEEQSKKAIQSEAAARAVLNDVLKRDVAEMKVLIDNDRRTYLLVVDAKVITIGGVGAIFSSELTSRAIWEATGKPLRALTKKQWIDVVLPALHTLRHEVNLDEDNGRVRRWLYDWFPTGGCLVANEDAFERAVQEMVAGELSFRLSGFAKLYGDYGCILRAHRFTSWVRQIGEDGNEETATTIRQKLIAIGFERKESHTVTFKDGAKVKLRDVYVGVVDWFRTFQSGDGKQLYGPENTA